MGHTANAHRPLLVLQGSHVFVDVEESIAEELQIHLFSHNVHTLAEHHRPGVLRLEVFDLASDEVNAIIEEWEVPPKE